MESRALAQYGLYPDAAAVHLDYLLRDRKPKSRTAFSPGICGIDLVELLENARPLLFRDSGAGVDDAHHEVSVASLGDDADLTCISELNCIADEIEQHLGKALLIAKANW